MKGDHNICEIVIIFIVTQLESKSDVSIKRRRSVCDRKLNNKRFMSDFLLQSCEHGSPDKMQSGFLRIISAKIVYFRCKLSAFERG